MPSQYQRDRNGRIRATFESLLEDDGDQRNTTSRHISDGDEARATRHGHTPRQAPQTRPAGQTFRAGLDPSRRALPAHRNSNGQSSPSSGLPNRGRHSNSALATNSARTAQATPQASTRQPDPGLRVTHLVITLSREPSGPGSAHHSSSEHDGGRPGRQGGRSGSRSAARQPPEGSPRYGPVVTFPGPNDRARSNDGAVDPQEGGMFLRRLFNWNRPFTDFRITGRITGVSIERGVRLICFNAPYIDMSLGGNQYFVSDMQRKRRPGVEGVPDSDITDEVFEWLPDSRTPAGWFQLMRRL